MPLWELMWTILPQPYKKRKEGSGSILPVAKANSVVHRSPFPFGVLELHSEPEHPSVAVLQPWWPQNSSSSSVLPCSCPRKIQALWSFTTVNAVVWTAWPSSEEYLPLSWHRLCGKFYRRQLAPLACGLDRPAKPSKQHPVLPWSPVEASLGIWGY